KPPPACQRNSRRVRPQGVSFGKWIAFILSVPKDELVGIQYHQAESRQRLLPRFLRCFGTSRGFGLDLLLLTAQKIQGSGDLLRTRRPAQRKLIGAHDLY